MSRTADYAIQGFLYQFNKTLLEVLKSAEDTEVFVEGIIEDIEINGPVGLTAIQCKYHEAKEKYSTSAIFKPLLQMMHHFQDNAQANVTYVVFAHFPQPPTNYSFGKDDLEAALASTNKDLQKYCDALRGKVDLDVFLARFSLEFGPSYDDLVASVENALVDAGIPKLDVDTLAYPNAIQAIANLSIKHDPNERRITRMALLRDLRLIKSTAITRWTLALKSRRAILAARRKQLKPHLDTNTRLRYFIVNSETLDDFDANIVGFVCDFLAKYHFKPAHLYTPLLCLDSSEDVFRDIQLRLHKRGVISTDGFVGRQFVESNFFREPMVDSGRGSSELRREFHLRLMRWEANANVLAQHKGHDLFIIGENRYSELDTQDVCVEVLESSSLREVAYVMGVSETHD